MDIKELIVDFAVKSPKSMFYFNDLLHVVKKEFPDSTIKDVKTAASELVKNEVLELFSTGSTTLYKLKGR
jgi:hypothetical protein